MAIISDHVLENKFYFVQEQKVMIDSDLAELYDVETRVLNQAVNRNKERFPKDFMFQLNKPEWNNLKLQNVISSYGGRRTLPYAFYRTWRINVIKRIKQLKSHTGKYSGNAGFYTHQERINRSY